MRETGGRTEDQVFVAGRDFYLHGAIKNVSEAAVPGTFQVGILVEGKLIRTMGVFGLEAHQVHRVTDVPISITTAGPHSVSLLVDATNLVPEVNEGAASLNCLGRTYRSHVLGEPRVKCAADGSAVPE